MLTKSLSYLQDKDDYFIKYVLVDVTKELEDDELDLYLDMLEMCLFEALIKKEDANYVSEFFDEYLENIKNKYNRIDLMIGDITKAKIELLSFANKNLVFDKLLINLTRR